MTNVEQAGGGADAPMDLTTCIIVDGRCTRLTHLHDPGAPGDRRPHPALGLETSGSWDQAPRRPPTPTRARWPAMSDDFRFGDPRGTDTSDHWKDHRTISTTWPDNPVPYHPGMRVTKGMRVRLPGGGLFEILSIVKDEKGGPGAITLNLEPVSEAGA